MNALLKEVLDYLDEIQDAGPPCAGWKSEKLEKLISDIQSILDSSCGYGFGD